MQHGGIGGRVKDGVQRLVIAVMAGINRGSASSSTSQELFKWWGCGQLLCAAQQGIMDKYPPVVGEAGGSREQQQPLTCCVWTGTSSSMQQFVRFVA